MKTLSVTICSLCQKKSPDEPLCLACSENKVKIEKLNNLYYNLLKSVFELNTKAIEDFRKEIF